MRPNSNESGRLLHPFCRCSRVTFTPTTTPSPPPPSLPQSDGRADAAEAASDLKRPNEGPPPPGAQLQGRKRNLLQPAQTEVSGSMTAGPRGAAGGRRSSRRIDPGLRRTLFSVNSS